MVSLSPLRVFYRFEHGTTFNHSLSSRSNCETFCNMIVFNKPKSTQTEQTTACIRGTTSAKKSFPTKPKSQASSAASPAWGATLWSHLETRSRRDSRKKTSHKPKDCLLARKIWLTKMHSDEKRSFIHCCHEANSDTTTLIVIDWFLLAPSGALIAIPTY